MAKKEKPTGTSVTPSEGSRGAMTRAEGETSGANVSPFAVMQRLMSDMDRFFEDVGFGGALLPQHLAMPDIRRGPSFEFTWWPQVDVVESGGKLLVRADLPGLKKEDLRISVEDDNLILEGERKIEKEGTEAGVYRAERSYGKFRRVILLPDGVDPDSGKAQFNDGVLEVSIDVPARESRSRRIEIGAREAGAERRVASEQQKGAPAQQKGAEQKPAEQETPIH
jgi:HSP20 family protein